MGRMVINNQIKHHESMDISHLKRGIYIVKLYQEKNLKGTKKILYLNSNL